MTSTVLEEAPLIAKEVLECEKSDLDDVQKAYNQVSADVQSVIAAGNTVLFKSTMCSVNVTKHMKLE